MSGHGWIGIDLDGTLAHYDGWKGPEHIGAPIPIMVERVKKMLAEGKDVRIFTARVCSGQPGDTGLVAMRAIMEWCKLHIGRPMAIVSEKDWAMIELWDDRAVQVVTNTGHRVDGKE